MSGLPRAASRGGRKLRLARAYLSGRPVWCSWQVTRRCQAFCHLCEHRLEGAELELDLASCRRVAEQLARAGALMVSLTGGDPFLRGDLDELVALLAQHHFPLVTTHGWLVTEVRARSLWEAGLTGASVVMHDADAARHDERVGLPGTHAKALQALHAFSQTRSAPGLQHVNIKTGPRQSAQSLEGLLELAAAQGASLTVESEFPLPLQDRGGLLPAERLLELKRGHPQLRSSAFFLAGLDQAGLTGVAGCLAGQAFFNVDHRGRVSKCIEYTGQSHELGDLTRETWAAVGPRLRKVPATNACRACWYSSRGEVERLYSWRGLLAGLPELLRA